MHSPRHPSVPTLSLIAIGYLIGVKLSLAFAVMPGAIVMLWLPNGLLLASLLHHHFKRYWLFAGLILAAEIAADYPTYSMVDSALYGCVNLFEVTLTFVLLRLWKFNSRFLSARDIGKFIVAGPVIGAVAAALFAGVVHGHFRDTVPDVLAFARVWWFSDATGLILMLPLVLCVWPTRPGVYHWRTSLRGADLIALILGIAVVALLLTAEEGRIRNFQIRPIWLIPLALYVAARLGMRATIVTLIAFSSVLLFITANGHRPFGNLLQGETVVRAQQVIFIMSATSLGLAGLLAQLRAITRSLKMRVEKRTAELRVANEQLSKLATVDPLTGALNRRALIAAMENEFERHKRHEEPLAVVMFDIDHFKAVNDRLGHAAGDAVLQHVTRITGRLIRQNDILARYGGEEFLVVAPKTTKESALELSERVRETILLTEVEIAEKKITVTASFGIAVMQPGDISADALLKRADEALYAAKRSGRNRSVADVTTSESWARAAG